MSDSPAVIHVVDDDAAFRAALSRVFRAAGYEVRTNESAGPAVRLRPSISPASALTALAATAGSRTARSSGADLARPASRFSRWPGQSVRSFWPS